MNVLPIGTVVRSGEAEVMIVGYSIYPEEQQVVAAYFVIPYPVGFQGGKSLGLMEIHAVEKVLAEGYRTEQEATVTDAFREIVDETEHLTPDAWNLLTEKLAEISNK